MMVSMKRNDSSELNLIIRRDIKNDKIGNKLERKHYVGENERLFDSNFNGQFKT